ncbi:RDD family protein [Buchananella hordeovulneris]|uniref:RDD family protein n=1 Tax=Buchananella hordeovulneris TaxID=52770 RepID=UPI0026DD640E|nr:RDD family protein [Buchananella hordeovulneris]MDO5079806.1 RDD family protein [Buchananella hordeovulneris]
MNQAQHPDTEDVLGRRLVAERLVTGEAVEIEAAPASPLLRAIATVIDFTLYFLVCLSLFIATTHQFGPDTDSQRFIAVTVLVVCITVLCPFIVELVSAGRSVGKYATGLRVVRDDGGPVAARHVLIRTVTAVIELWLTFGIVAFLFTLFSPRSKRGGDLLAGTYVVATAHSAGITLPLVCPPELEQWARQADVHRLPPQLALAGRRLLLAGGEGALAQRAVVARQLAAQFERYVSPPPPWGTHPERFLAATLTARRDREYVFLRNQAQRRQQESNQLERGVYGIGA